MSNSITSDSQTIKETVNFTLKFLMKSFINVSNLNHLCIFSNI